MMLVATLGNKKLGILQFPLHLKRYDDLFRRAAEPLSDIRNGLDQQILVAFVKLAFILIGEALVDGTVLDVYIINVRVLLVLVIRDGEDIYIGDCMAHNLTLRNEVL